jgi:Ca2+-binding RTX toxin-like protein
MNLNNRVLRTIALVVSPVVAAIFATVTFTPPASAAVSCSQAGTSLTVTLTAEDDEATFLRGPSREILVNGVQCGTATTENTQTVTVTGTDADQYVYVDLAGGPFVSLQRETSPPSGTSVQFQVDLGGDLDDQLYIYGTAAADTFVAGVNGITLDQTSPAGELDVVPTGIDGLLLYGRGENDFLSSSGDNMTGAPIADSLWVALNGEAGNDTLVGGNNLDFRPGPGDDTMAGQSTAALVLASAPGPVKVDLAAGTATGEGNDTFSGVSGVLGSGFADELIGDGADNYLIGGQGGDVIRGAGGDDTIVGGLGDDDLDGETGSDTYPNSYTYGWADDDAITDSGADAGDDDTADFYGFAGTVSVDLAAGTATGVGADTLAGIETVRGTDGADTLLGASGGETLLGMGGNDVLTGRGGADELQGGAGDDLLRPGAGNDNADGGPGANTIAFDEAPSGVNVSLAAGTASGEGTDTFAAIRRVRGSAFADVLRGSGAADALLGLGGADTLVGGGGADLLDGGPGLDTTGYATAPSAVTVDLAKGKAGRGAGVDSLHGLENVVGSPYADLLVGSSAANVLRGASGPDTLKGAAGNDRLYGMSASDTLVGGGGADLLDGGPGLDTAGYATAPSAVTVDLAKGKAGRGAGADSLHGLENVVGSPYADLLLGSSAANVLRGASGPDTLKGAGGNDRLYGMSASDALYGAAGNDLLSGSTGAHDLCSQGSGTGRRIGCELH